MTLPPVSAAWCCSCAAESGQFLRTDGGMQCAACYRKVTETMRTRRPDLAAVRDGYLSGKLSAAVRAAQAHGFSRPEIDSARRWVPPGEVSAIDRLRAKWKRKRGSK